MNYDPEDARLTAHALGELPPDEAREVEALMATSPEARQEVEEIRGFAELLTQVFEREAAANPVPEAEAEALLAGAPEPELAPAPVVSGEEPAVVESSEAADDKVVPMPREGSRWGLWAGIGVAAAICLLGAAAWLPARTRSAAVKQVALRAKEPAPAVDRGAVVYTEPSGTVAASGPTAVVVEETTTDPVPADSLSAAASPPPPVGAQEPQLMRRYGLIPSPGAAPAPGPAPTVPPPLGGESPTFAMSPELMRRYGLIPSPGAAPASGPAPAPAPTLPPPPAGEPATLAMTPESKERSAPAGGPGPQAGVSSAPASSERMLTTALRARYGVGAAGSGRTALADRLDLAQAPRESAGRDYYYRGEAGRPELLTESKESVSLDAAPEGRNPGYVDAVENAFVSPLTQPLSTFGLDVDTGSYANVRRFLNAGTFPPRAAVRVEEMINYFPYGHAEPSGDDVFGVRADVAKCPWEPRHRLVRIALKAKAVTGERPVANLVFLVDVSGSMQPAERLPLLKQALRALAKRLAPSDRVAIVTYASSAGVRLPSTSAEEKDRILEAIDSLESGGSTNGEGGIRQAYEVARRHFIPGGVNRVLLCTDGDFNVGMSDQNELVRLIESEAKSGVFLTTLGVGTDNFKDALMRRLADRGNGSYHYLDSHEEAQRVLLEQRDATFITVARDAKAQVEFNPGNVAAWRLIGYEKRLMPAQDFNDDTKDAGEVGAGQTVTVLYEVVPVGVQAPGSVDPLKYQSAPAEESPKRVFARTSELLTLKLRYQRPEGSKSVLKEIAVPDRERDADGDFRFAAAVAAFGMALRDPSWDGGRGFDMALDLARSSVGEDPGGWRSEFLTLVRKARGMRR